MAVNKSRDQYLDAYLAVVAVTTTALQAMPTIDATVGLARAQFLVDKTGAPIDSTHPLFVSSTGSGVTAQQVQGTAADGAAAVGNPVQTGGVDGSSNAQAFLTDTTGRQVVVGGATSGTAVSGNPVLVAGSDGTNARSLATNAAGQLVPPPGFGSPVSITRTNDTNVYAANDVIGAATGSTAAITFTLAAGAGEVIITSVALEIDIAAVVSGMTSFNLALYNVTPPSALGDNAAWDLPSGDRASFLGLFSLGTPVDLGSTLWVGTEIINKQITTAGATVFGYLITVGAWTPAASTVFKVTLHTVPV